MDLHAKTAEELAGLSFCCSCGETHRTETKKFLSGRGAVNKLVRTVEETKAENILLVTAEDVYNKYGRSIELLLRKRFRVTVHVFEAGFVPTLLRVSELAKYSGAEAVVCFGSGGVADVSKYHCSVKNVPLIAVLTSPCADLSGYTSLMLNGRSERMLAASPYAVIADFDLVKTAPPSMIASAFGWIAGTALSLFEWKFAYLIGREPYCATLAKYSSELLSQALTAGEKYVACGDGIEELTEILLRHAACAQMLNRSRLSESSATLTASVLQVMNAPKGQGNLLGERVMLSSYRLVKLFRHTLSEDVTMPLLPADKQKRARLLSEICGTDAGETLARLYDRPRINMEIANHKIKEYRPELLGELKKFEDLLARAIRIFRRVYPDGGYWLKNCNLPELRTAIYLAPELSETFTVLTLLRDSGVLEYIA